MSRSRAVRVELGDRAYEVRIGHGILAGAGAAVRAATGAERAVVVTVPPVGRRYGRVLLASLAGAGIRASRVTVPDGDATKSLAWLRRLYEAFLDRGVDRGTAVVSLGGGMVGDLAGFAAATFLRGLPLVQVPTSLLAMVDASVGGKVAVNLPRGKNLVGCFHQPRLVWADLETLGSLPRRERAAGLAEIVKAGAILDEALFEWLERRLLRVLDLERRSLLHAVEQACRIKAEVVARDEREAGHRMLLNFGHTLGHAVERLQRYRGLLHGEAVAAGMVFAARRSEELGLAPGGTAERLRALLARADLPTEIPPFDRRAYLRALQVDKKRREREIRFVALRRIGCAEVVSLRPAEILPPRALGRGVARSTRG